MFNELTYLSEGDGPNRVCLHALKLERLTVTLYVEAGGGRRGAKKLSSMEIADIVYEELRLIQKTRFDQTRLVM